MRARVIALGHPMRSDDGAALIVAERLRGRPELASVDVIAAGRPGPGLLDLLDPSLPTLLLDVVRTGQPSGTLVEVPLAELPERVRTAPRASSHGLGPADAIALGRALGRPLPPGWLIGAEGERFEAGDTLSPALAARMDDWCSAVLRRLEEMCTSTDSSTGS